MKHLLISFIYLLGTLCSVNAQIKGKVLNTNNQPIEFVNIALYSLPDSSLITGTVTDATGNFLLETSKTQNSFLQVSFIGYKTVRVAARPEQTIVLQPETIMINEVIVKGSLPKIRLKNDALVATIQNSVLSKAGTANDVLKRLPSLTGDNGKFTVFGKGEAKIYINNREMRDVSELDNLSSADIKDVEIVNNPGARYDATVKAVIRIHTVRKAGDGFSFDARSSYWQSKSTNLKEQLNINYRKNGLDIFGTISYDQNHWIQQSDITQKVHVDTIWGQSNTLQSHLYTKTLTGITGINYEISPKHYTGIKYTLSAFPQNKMHTTTISSVFANDTFYDKWESDENKTSRNQPSHRLNAYYNGKFGKLKIDFNTDFYTASESSKSLVTEKSQEFDDRAITAENNVHNRLFASKLVFSYPIWNGQLSFGNQFTDTYRKDEYSNKEQIVPSSDTQIKESNNAFFVEYMRATPIGQIGAGLRYEDVHFNYFIEGKKSDEQSRKYGQWFPSLSFSTLVKNVAVQLSYTAKTQRPSYWQLSSNVFYLNRFSMQQGNPFLKPATVHDITLISAWKYIQLITSYKQEHNAILHWTEQLGGNPKVSLIRFRNFDKLPSLSVFLMASPRFGIWQPQASLGYMKQWLTITSVNKPVNLNRPLVSASLNNSISLPNKFLLTCDMSWIGKGDTRNIYIAANQFITNIGVQKSFLNDQLNISLKGHDIFNGRNERLRLYNARMDLFQDNIVDSRKIELTVRYKFNTAKSKYKGSAAGESEIKRF